MPVPFPKVFMIKRRPWLAYHRAGMVTFAVLSTLQDMQLYQSACNATQNPHHIRQNEFDLNDELHVADTIRFTNEQMDKLLSIK